MKGADTAADVLISPARNPQTVTKRPVDEHSLFCRTNESASRTVRIASGMAGLFSVRNPHKLSDNEDAAALIPIDRTRAVLAVADGVGGRPAGAVAAEMVLQSLIDEAAKIRNDGITLQAGIMEAIDLANGSIQRMGIGAATTLAVIEIDGTRVRPYHVGDSMILIAGRLGKLRHQTVPHSPVGYAVEAGLLDQREAIHHEDRHVVSNVVGSPNMRVEVGSVLTLKAWDTVLLASDGVFDNLHVEEVVALIRTGPIPEVVEHLAAAARQRMETPEPGHPSKPDDTTFIVYRRAASVATRRGSTPCTMPRAT